MERLILLPDHLLSLKKANENNSVYCWKVNRIINVSPNINYMTFYIY